MPSTLFSPAYQGILRRHDLAALYGIGLANNYILAFHNWGSDYMPQGKFEIYRDRSGEYRFRLKAANGQTIAIGQGYSSKASCMKGIASIRKNAPDAQIIELEVEVEL